MVDRLGGKVKGYPMSVPQVDWWWMIGGFLSMVYAGYVAGQCKIAEAQVKKSQPPAQAKPTVAAGS